LLTVYVCFQQVVKKYMLVLMKHVQSVDRISTMQNKFQALSIILLTEWQY